MHWSFNKYRNFHCLKYSFWLLLPALLETYKNLSSISTTTCLNDIELVFQFKTWERFLKYVVIMCHFFSFHLYLIQFHRWTQVDLVRIYQDVDPMKKCWVFILLEKKNYMCYNACHFDHLSLRTLVQVLQNESDKKCEAQVCHVRVID